MALPDILSELEACGYRTRVFHIPASGVGARHHRYRVAIVGYSEHNGLSSTAVAGSVEKTGGGEQERKKTAGESPGARKPGNSKAVGRAQNLENTGCIGFGKQGSVCEQPREAESERTSETLADTESQIAGRLPVGEKTGKSGFIGSCENVQYAHGAGCQKQHTAAESNEEGFTGRRCDEGNICDTTSERLSNGSSESVGGQGTQEQESKRPDSNVSDSDNRSRDVRRDGEFPTIKETERAGSNIGGRAQKHESGERRTVESVLGGVVDGFPAGMDGDLDFLINHYWDDEPDIPRIATGIEHRVDRLKCLGNAVVPQQFYPIFKAIAITMALHGV